MNNKYFEVKVNKNSCKDMFEFLKNHFIYYTMNSWNNLKSIANNVKVYNIGLDYNVLGKLQEDNYFNINCMIEDWENKNQDYLVSCYLVSFNGKNGGYLVLYNKENNYNVLDDYFDYCDNYDEFKQQIREDYGSLKNYKDRLVSQVKIVCSFDRLCDDLRNYCLSLESDEVENYE